jgi:hypothetical protein
MEVTRIRALRGPNLWSRHTAIEAVVTCDAAERDLRATPAFEQRSCASCSPPSAHCTPINPQAQRADVHGPRAGADRPGAAGAGRLPSHLQPHHPDRGRGHLPGRGAVHRGSRRPAGLREGPGCCAAPPPKAVAASTLAAALAELRELDEDERLGPSTGAIVDAAVAARHSLQAPDHAAAWCSSAGAAASAASRRRGGWHQRHRRIHRPGQGPDQEAAARRRRAGAAGPPGGRPGRRLGRRAGDRPARRGQAAGRQPGQGRHRRHHRPRAFRRRLPRRRRVRHA